jgi:hypothetical protein
MSVFVTVDELAQPVSGKTALRYLRRRCCIPMPQGGTENHCASSSSDLQNRRIRLYPMLARFLEQRQRAAYSKTEVAGLFYCPRTAQAARWLPYHHYCPSNAAHEQPGALPSMPDPSASGVGRRGA